MLLAANCGSSTRSRSTGSIELWIEFLDPLNALHLAQTKFREIAQRQSVGTLEAGNRISQQAGRARQLALQTSQLGEVHQIRSFSTGIEHQAMQSQRLLQPTNSVVESSLHGGQKSEVTRVRGLALQTATPFFDGKRASPQRFREFPIPFQKGVATATSQIARETTKFIGGLLERLGGMP